jgi:hypothetical protein
LDLQSRSPARCNNRQPKTPVLPRGLHLHLSESADVNTRSEAADTSPKRCKSRSLIRSSRGSAERASRRFSSRSGLVAKGRVKCPVVLCLPRGTRARELLWLRLGCVRLPWRVRTTYRRLAGCAWERRRSWRLKSRPADSGSAHNPQIIFRARNAFVASA